MGVREATYQALVADPQMNLLGINADNLFANGRPDSPQADVFGVLHWGSEVPGIKRVARNWTSVLWVYDRNPDYTRIKDIIKRWCEITEALPGQPTGDGWFLGADWVGDGADDFDDVYERYTRSSEYTIVASGD